MLIHTAAKRGLVHLVEKKIALNEGLENLVHRTNRKQLEYPLHAAAMGGHIACVSALIEAKAEIDSLDRQNETPLIWAVRAGHAPVIQMLVNAGASIHRSNLNDQKPMHVAASSGHVASIEALLDVDACITDTDSDGWTPIMTAVRHGNAAAVRFLHEAGAPIDVLPPLERNWAKSRNLLQFAVKCQQPACIALLMQLGADYLLPDAEGQTVEEYMNSRLHTYGGEAYRPFWAQKEHRELSAMLANIPLPSVQVAPEFPILNEVGNNDKEHLYETAGIGDAGMMMPSPPPLQVPRRMRL